MNGREIWLAMNTTPYTANRRSTVRSTNTPRTAPRPRRSTLPVGTTTGRISRVPKPTSSAVPTESPADSR